MRLGRPSDSRAGSLLLAVDALRKEGSERLDPQRRIQMGQFLTPSPIAAFMAGMFDCRKSEVRILDPGAGTGSLGAALVVSLCQRPKRPARIALTVYEIDPLLVDYLRNTLERCRVACEEVGVPFHGRLAESDFLEAGVNSLAGGLFARGEEERFDCAILNPPYRKIRTQSRERSLLRSIGLETTNLYTGFVAVAARLLEPGGLCPTRRDPPSWRSGGALGSAFLPRKSLIVLSMRCSSMDKIPAKRRSTAAKRIDEALAILASLEVRTERCPTW